MAIIIYTRSTNASQYFWSHMRAADDERSWQTGGREPKDGRRVSIIAMRRRRYVARSETSPITGILLGKRQTRRRTSHSESSDWRGDGLQWGRVRSMDHKTTCALIISDSCRSCMRSGDWTERREGRGRDGGWKLKSAELRRDWSNIGRRRGLAEVAKDTGKVCLANHWRQTNVSSFFQLINASEKLN